MSDSAQKARWFLNSALNLPEYVRCFDNKKLINNLEPMPNDIDPRIKHDEASYPVLPSLT